VENPAKRVRDDIIRNLRNDEGYKAMTAADINGIISAAADVALPKDGGVQIFRIAVVPYDTKREFA